MTKINELKTLINLTGKNEASQNSIHKAITALEQIKNGYRDFYHIYNNLGQVSLETNNAIGTILPEDTGIDTMEDNIDKVIAIFNNDYENAGE